MIEHLNLLDVLSKARLKELTKEADEYRQAKQALHNSPRVSHRLLSELGKAMEGWGADLRKRYHIAPTNSHMS